MNAAPERLNTQVQSFRAPSFARQLDRRVKVTEKARDWAITREQLDADPETREDCASTQRNRKHRATKAALKLGSSKVSDHLNGVATDTSAQRKAREDFARRDHLVQQQLNEATDPPRSFPKPPSARTQKTIAREILSSLEEKSCICALCDLLTSRDVHFSRFDTKQKVWMNILKTCKSPTDLPSLLRSQYSVVEKAGIQELNDVLLSPRGVLFVAPCIYSKTYDEAMSPCSEGSSESDDDDVDIDDIDNIDDSDCSDDLSCNLDAIDATEDANEAQSVTSNILGSLPVLPSFEETEGLVPNEEYVDPTNSEVGSVTSDNLPSVDSSFTALDDTLMSLLGSLDVPPHHEGVNAFPMMYPSPTAAFESSGISPSGDDVALDELFAEFPANPSAATHDDSPSPSLQDSDVRHPIFVICSECYKHYSSSSCEKPSKASIANGHYFGWLPDEHQPLLTDIVKYLLAPLTPFTKFKTWHSGPLQGKRAVGNVAILDLGASLAHVIKDYAIREGCDRLRILVHPRLSAADKSRIRTMECAKVSDLVTLLKYLVEDCKNKIFRSEIEVMVRKISGLATDGVIDPVEEVEFRLPESRTNVLGEAPPLITVRFYSAGVMKESQDVHVLAKEAVEAATKERVGTVDITPGNRFTSLEEEDAFQRTFPWYFPFGYGPINPRRPVRTSLKYEIQRLFRMGRYDDFMFIAACFSYVKQKQISNSICFKAAKMDHSTINKILHLQPTEIVTALEDLAAGKSTRNPLVQPVNASLGSAYGSNAERLRMRRHAFAQVGVFGGWTYFLTFSPGVENNDILFKSRYDPSGVDFEENLDGTFSASSRVPFAPTKECCQELAKNVTSSVLFMDNFVRLIVEVYLGWDIDKERSRPEGGMLGIVQAIALSYETNSRGHLHVHMLVRLRDAPRTREEFHDLHQRNPARFRHRLETYVTRTVFSDYDIKLEDAVCPGCKKQNTFKEFLPTSAAYGSVNSRLLKPLINVTCSNPECRSQWVSSDVVRQTALTGLAGREVDIDEGCAQTSGPMCLKDMIRAARNLAGKAYCKEATLDLVRTLFFRGGSALTSEILENEECLRWWRVLIASMFQEHLTTHTSTCKKNRSNGVCRMRFPRPLVQATGVLPDGSVEVRKWIFSEWMNSSPMFGLELFHCNLDATFLLSGTVDFIRMILYGTKYLGKAQTGLDNAFVQLIIVHFLRNFPERINRIKDEEKDEVRGVMGLMRSLAWAMTKADELDPEMMVHHLLHGSPSFNTHQFVEVPVWRFRELLRDDEEEGPMFRLVGGRLRLMGDATMQYCFRPETDESLSMFGFFATRMVTIGTPVIPAHRLREGFPNSDKRKVVPRLRVPVFNPTRPNTANLRTRRTYFDDHSACIFDVACRPVRRPCRMLGPLPKGADVSIDQSQCLEDDIDHGTIDLEPDYFAPEGDEDVGEAEGEDHVLRDSSDEGEDGDDVMSDEQEEAEDDVLNFHGEVTAVTCGKYHHPKELIKCRNETGWDLGQRVLAETYERKAKGDADAALCIRWHENTLQLERNRKDYERERFTASAHETAVNDAFNSLGSGGAPREEQRQEVTEDSGEDDEELTSAALEAVQKEDQRMFLESQRQKQVRRYGEAAVSALYLARECAQFIGCVRRVDPLYSFPQGMAQLYRREALRLENQDVSSAHSQAEEESGPKRQRGTLVEYRSRDTVITHLESVAEEYTLVTEQRLAFFSIAIKALQAILGSSSLQARDIGFQCLGVKYPPPFFEKPLRMILTGQGGSGKSRVIDALRRFLKDLGKADAMMVLAYMGVAAVNSGGTTIHSGGGLSISRSDVGKERSVTQETKERWAPVKVLLIDEYGMCGKSLFARLDEVARGAKNNNNKSFGGLDVVLVGDHFQFDPTFDSSLHNEEINPNHRDASRFAQADLVFSEFNQVIRLAKNHRVDGGDSFGRFLRRLRSPMYFRCESHMREDLRRLNQRLVTTCEVERTTVAPLILVSTNAERRAYTDQMKCYLRTQGPGGLVIFEWTAKLHQPLTAQDIQIVEEYSWLTRTKIRTPIRFWAYVGMPVAVTKNVSKDHQKLGVATGAHGTIVGFKWRESTNFALDQGTQTVSEPPEFILVKFRTPSEHKFYNMEDNIRPIGVCKEKGTTRFDRKLGKCPAVHYEYESFPLRHRFAATFHSVQCLTEENIILTRPKGVDRQKMFYLGLSRAKSFKSVRVLEKFTEEMVREFQPLERDIRFDEELQQHHKIFLAKVHAHGSLRSAPEALCDCIEKGKSCPLSGS